MHEYINPSYFTACADLSHFLTVARVPFKVEQAFDGFQFTFPWCKGDCILHRGSFEHHFGMFESYRFPWDNGDVSTHTAAAMAALLAQYFREKTEE